MDTTEHLRQPCADWDCKVRGTTVFSVAMYAALAAMIVPRLAAIEEEDLVA
jgi:hypothetical protein